MLKLLAIGHLGKDAVTNTVNGKNVINFSIAHSEKYKDAQGNQKETTQWVECAYWTDKTGIVPYLKKGTQVFVSGNPQVKTYQKQDGTQGVSLTVRVNEISLLGSAQGNGNGQSQTNTGSMYDSAQPTTNVADQSGAGADVQAPLTKENLPF